MSPGEVDWDEEFKRLKRGETGKAAKLNEVGLEVERTGAGRERKATDAARSVQRGAARAANSMPRAPSLSKDAVFWFGVIAALAFLPTLISVLSGPVQAGGGGALGGDLRRMTTPDSTSSASTASQKSVGVEAPRRAGQEYERRPARHLRRRRGTQVEVIHGMPGSSVETQPVLLARAPRAAPSGTLRGRCAARLPGVRRRPSASRRGPAAAGALE